MNWLDAGVIGVIGVVIGSITTGGWQMALERSRRKSARATDGLRVRREVTMSAIEAADALINRYRALARAATPSDLGRAPTEEEDAKQLDAMLKVLAGFEDLRVQSLRVMVLGSARVGIAIEGIRQEARDMHNRMLEARILNADDFNATMDKLGNDFGELMLMAKEEIGTEKPSLWRAWWYRAQRWRRRDADK